MPGPSLGADDSLRAISGLMTLLPDRRMKYGPGRGGGHAGRSTNGYGRSLWQFVCRDAKFRRRYGVRDLRDAPYRT